MDDELIIGPGLKLFVCYFISNSFSNYKIWKGCRQFFLPLSYSSLILHENICIICQIYVVALVWMSVRPSDCHKRLVKIVTLADSGLSWFKCLIEGEGGSRYPYPGPKLTLSENCGATVLVVYEILQ